MELKPGYKTSEFWLTLASAVAGVLVAVGLFTAEEADQIVAVAKTLIGAIFGLVAALMPIINYIKSRTQLKSLDNGS